MKKRFKIVSKSQHFIYFITEEDENINWCLKIAVKNTCQNEVKMYNNLVIGIVRKEKRRFPMNKEELVREVAKVSKLSQKTVSDVISAVVETVQKSVSKGNKVTLVGFGTFERKERAARTGRNPQTGKEIKIAAKKVPTFSAGKKFKEAVK